VHHATGAQRARLTEVGTPGLTEDDIVELQDVLVATGALRAVESRIRMLTADAVAAIDTPAVPAPARTALIELARFIAAREH
jgi:geranylgeranyl diphosphate synthase, type I